MYTCAHASFSKYSRTLACARALTSWTAVSRAVSVVIHNLQVAECIVSIRTQYPCQGQFAGLWNHCKSQSLRVYLLLLGAQSGFVSSWWLKPLNLFPAPAVGDGCHGTSSLHATAQTFASCPTPSPCPPVKGGPSIGHLFSIMSDAEHICLLSRCARRQHVSIKVALCLSILTGGLIQGCELLVMSVISSLHDMLCRERDWHGTG